MFWQVKTVRDSIFKGQFWTKENWFFFCNNWLLLWWLEILNLNFWLNLNSFNESFEWWKIFLFSSYCLVDENFNWTKTFFYCIFHFLKRVEGTEIHSKNCALFVKLLLSLLNEKKKHCFPYISSQYYSIFVVVAFNASIVNFDCL
jgi:hypothetical protein